MGHSRLKDELAWEEKVLDPVGLFETSTLSWVELEVVVDLPGPTAVDIVSYCQDQVRRYEGGSAFPQLGLIPGLEC